MSYKKPNSILQEDTHRCFICGRYMKRGIHCHHVFGGTANRQHSDDWGLVVYLCPYHHNMSDNSVHFNTKMREDLQAFAQKKFEEKYGHEKWMSIFHKNYIKGRDEDGEQI